MDVINHLLGVRIYVHVVTIFSRILASNFNISTVLNISKDFPICFDNPSRGLAS